MEENSHPSFPVCVQKENIFLDDHPYTKNNTVLELDVERLTGTTEISPYRSFMRTIQKYYMIGKSGDMQWITEQEYTRLYTQSFKDPTQPAPSIGRYSYQINILPYLLHEFADRYELSISDRLNQIRKSKVEQLWAAVIAHEMQITPSASKASTWNGTNVKITTKNASHKKLENEIIAYYQKKKLFHTSISDKLCCDKDRHKPQSVVIPFTDEQGEKLIELFSTVSNKYKTTYVWKNVHIVPYQLYNGFIEMMVIIPQSQYEKNYGKPYCIRVSRPSVEILNHDTQQYERWVENQESFLIYTPSRNHLKLIPNLPPNTQVMLLPTTHSSCIDVLRERKKITNSSEQNSEIVSESIPVKRKGRKRKYDIQTN